MEMQTCALNELSDFWYDQPQQTFNNECKQPCLSGKECVLNSLTWAVWGHSPPDPSTCVCPLLPGLSVAERGPQYAALPLQVSCWFPALPASVAPGVPPDSGAEVMHVSRVICYTVKPRYTDALLLTRMSAGGNLDKHKSLIKTGTKSCLQLPHLMELHPEVRDILPELQEVHFEWNRALVRRARAVLGRQDRRATWTERMRQFKNDNAANTRECRKVWKQCRYANTYMCLYTITTHWPHLETNRRRNKPRPWVSKASVLQVPITSLEKWECIFICWGDPLGNKETAEST